MSYLLRSKIGGCLRRLGLYSLAINVIRQFWRILSFITNRDKRLFNQYIHNYNVHKLHIGCGSNYLENWFNTDLYPNLHRTRLNATRQFPFPDNSFDFIFSEHMIEHIPYSKGYIMLSECFRVLKPGGTIRIVTPDLRFLMNLYHESEKPINKNYIEWNAELFIGKGAPHNAVSVINNFFRDWGHQYIYDVAVMCKTFEKIGFTNIINSEINKSTNPELCCLEHDERLPDGFLALESMVIEAKKPI